MKLPDSIAGHDDVERRHRKTGFVSAVCAFAATIVTCLGVVVPLWNSAFKPILVTAVATAAADELDGKVAAAVKTAVQPLKTKVDQTNARVDATNSGLKAIIRSNIADLEEDIDELEYLRDFRDEEFNDERREELFKKRNELRVQTEALDDIQAAESGGTSSSHGS